MGHCTILGVALVCACSSGATQPDQPWTVVAENQPSSLQSVWASSDSDVYVVGGDRGDNTGPIVNHYDGTTWTQLDAGVRNVNLWWVFGFAGGPVFMSGTNGTIVERHPNGTFETLATPGNLIVFGMWGAAPDDLWAVGGNYGGGGFLWHYDGSTWTASADVPADIQSQGTIWKIGGRSATDIWMGCTGGTMLHWSGALERTDLSIDGSLLSVAGNGQRFVTVGAATGGVLFENDGSGWKSALPEGGNSLTGVAISQDQAYAVGEFGTILRRSDSGWSTEMGVMTTQNLHGAFIDPSGGAWAAGGMFDSTPQTNGVLLHKGNALLGSFP